MPEKDDNYIRARFMVNKKAVTIYANFHEVSAVLRWERKGNPDLQVRHVRTLIGNLDSLVAQGIQEVIIQAEMQGLDAEWAGFTESGAGDTDE